MNQAASPREVILKLLLASRGDPLTTREAVAGCALLGISETHARVALVRLSNARMIAATDRGVYQLGPQAIQLAADVAKWRVGEGRVRAWDGGWVVVHTATLGRRDRSAVRTRDRALALLGLRELDQDLYARPDNLAGGVAIVRERLQVLGLEPQAAVFIATQFDEERERRARSLWDGKALTRGYTDGRQQLEAWMGRVHNLDPQAAARESYLLGDEAIHHLVFDPLLPEPLVDTAARAAFTAIVLRFDDLGRDIWRRVLAYSSSDRSARDAVASPTDDSKKARIQ